MEVSGVGQFQSRPNVGGQLPTLAGKGSEIALHLESMPETIGLGEKSPKTDGHCGSDGALAEDDLIDGARRDADGPGHAVLRDAHRQKILLQQDFSRGDRCLHRP